MRLCSTCNASLPPTARECPSCLLKLALTASGSGSGRTFRPPAPDALAGKIPGVQPLELVGQGGMGAVYRARQAALERDVALKILLPERAADPQFAQRFLREARALARLRHPYVLEIYDAGRTDEFLYILMEYVDGVTLRELIRGGKLPPAEALRLAPQLCEALQYAHNRGVIHRDIKPENVLIDQEGNIKIADFGLAKIGEKHAGETGLTESNVGMGTVRYMAPEQHTDPGGVDHRADIYSLGVTLYEMLTGTLPTLNYQPPSRKADVDVRVDRVIERSIRDSPNERYQQAAEMQRDVETIVSRPGKRFSPPWIAGGIIAAALLVALIVAWIPEPPSSSPSNFSSQPKLMTAPFTATEISAARREWAEHLQKPLEVTNDVDVTLTLIPPGEFAMGATDEELRAAAKVVDEGDNHRLNCVLSAAPQHRTVLSQPFYVSRTEITQAQFREVTGETPAFFSVDGDERPVERVSWHDAVRFCRLLSEREGLRGDGYRLPTEAEWEYLCRAGTETPYAVGADSAEMSRVGWIKVNSDAKTHPVGKLEGNAFGVFDLHGNVWEWCGDWWSAEYFQKFATEPARDPQGAAESPLGERVIRGGYFEENPALWRSAARDACDPNQRQYHIGFRIVLPVDAVRAAVVNSTGK